MAFVSECPLIKAERILVIMPNRLGDAVMATPFLRSLRGIYPRAHIAALGRELVLPVLAGLPFVDRILCLPIEPEGEKRKVGQIATTLKSGKYNLAVLLPNSFRSALLAWRAGIPRRLGYRRDGRGFLLTDYLRPIPLSGDEIDLRLARAAARKLIAAGAVPESVRLERAGSGGGHPDPDHQRDRGWRLRPGDPAPPGPLPMAGRTHTGSHTDSYDHPIRVRAWRRLAYRRNFQPIPAIDYYLALAGRLGGATDDRRMELGITAAEQSEATAALEEFGVLGRSFMLLFPGANFGSSKCWPPEFFARVAAAVADPAGPSAAPVLIAAAPAETPLVNAVLRSLSELPGGRALRNRVRSLAAFREGRGVGLGAIKELVRRASLVLCNDTGPRHFAAAFATPLVTLFGPTDPRWAQTFHAGEKQLWIQVPCGPCQLARCPVDHRCLRGLAPPLVLEAIRSLWRDTAP